MKAGRCAVILIALIMMSVTVSFSQNGNSRSQRQLPPAGSGKTFVADDRYIPIPAEEYSVSGNHFNLFTGALEKSRKPMYPLFTWPLENAIHDGIVLVNYVDHDNTSGIEDYMGNPHSYNGHKGTDMTLFNFRIMDRGVRILAAAAGTVTDIQYARYDRNTGPPYPDTGNKVVIQHSDGTYARYYHLRKNSVTVQVGETVQRGEVLGLVGSSGYSTDPHLHFEVGEYISSTWYKRDPFNGTNNALASLWENQEPYIGDAPICVYDLGVTTEDAAGGNLYNFPFDLFRGRLTQPAVFGIDEPFIAVWLQVQCQAGDSYKLEIRRPDSTLFQSATHNIYDKLRNGWYYWFWSFAGYASVADYGTWTAQIVVGGNIVKRVYFDVGATSIYAPRFSPLAGRSIRITGNEQQDNLSVSPLSGPVTFSLLNAPDFVTLTDS
ncbi:M23 family metallopeptidase, partial [candidate division KSB1 bacterium]